MSRWHLLPRPQRIRIERAVDELLLQEWDPIGVRRWPEAADEYSSYVPPILSLLDRDRPLEEIAAKLRHFRTQHMGGLPDDVVDAAVAQKAMRLWAEICGQSE